MQSTATVAASPNAGQALQAAMISVLLMRCSVQRNQKMVMRMRWSLTVLRHLVERLMLREKRSQDQVQDIATVCMDQ